MTSEPLQRWTKEQVQQWFLAGDYQEYASCFPINGRQLAVLEEKHFIEAIGLIPGACLFADVQRLKPPQQAPPQQASQAARTTLPYTGSPLRAATNADIRKMQEKLRQEMQVMEGRMLREVRKGNLKDRTDRSAPSTFAERYQRISAKNIVPLPWFSILDQLPLVHKQRRQQPGRKAEGVQPLFPSYPATSTTRDGYPAAEASESRVVQPYWSDRLALFPRELPITLVDTYNKVSYGRRKPDVVGYVTGKPRSIFYIALVGDVKARRTAEKEDFDDSEKGHLQSFLEDLLFEYQPYRSVVNGFLTDGYLIQFFCLRKLPNGIEWTESPVLWLHADGGKWLLGLLKDTAVHGLPQDIMIDRDPVIINELLGIGGSAVVYSGQYREETVVVKRFNSADEEGHLRNEERRLRQVANLVPLVPKLIACDTGQLVLLLSPVGDNFASRLSHFTYPNIHDAGHQTTVATADDFCQLVNILEKVHKDYKLVHRDVRLSNFFRCLDTGTVFLNDWGCATEVGVKVKFSGALQYAPDGVLECWRLNQAYEPAFAHDLEMVVKSVFHTLSITTFEEICAEVDVDNIIAFWKCHLTPSIWSSMLAAAQNEDYETLKKQIQDLLPGSTNAECLSPEQ